MNATYRPTTSADIEIALQRFGLVDYAVFVLMLIISVFIGVYHGFCTGKMSTSKYLMGGHNMNTFPVALSLIASFFSGITLIGIPTEVYLYGIQYAYVSGGIIAMGVAVGTAYLPVFHDLKLTSIYEYLEMRYNKKVRLLGSFLFVLENITWLPLVIYVASLTLNQVTGINLHIISSSVCTVCIFYTCVGGLKAVVWTDAVQIVIMFGAMMVIVIKGTTNVGGFSTIWERNYASSRIEPPNFSLDFTVRQTFFGLMAYGFFWYLETMIGQQYMIQRYFALPTLHSARIALFIFVVGLLCLIFMCTYIGLLIFATYHNCDPLTTKLATVKDQVLPLLVMDTLKDLPGVSGLFLAGIFSAALSSMSSGLNSMAVIVLEDLYKATFKHELSPKHTNILLKSTVVVTGVLCICIVPIFEKLGAVLQVTISLSGIMSGALFGLFSMGIFMPWINSKGAFIGGVTSLAFMAWISTGAQHAISSGDIRYPTKPVSVEGCTYDFVTPASVIRSTELNLTISHFSEDVFPLYKMSYLWYTLTGAIVTMSVGLLVSFSTNPRVPVSRDPMLFSPIIRRFLPKKEKEQSNADAALLSC